MTEEIKLQISKAVTEWLNPEDPNRSQKKLERNSGVNTRFIIAIKKGETFTINFQNVKNEDGTETRVERQVPIADEHYYKLATAVNYKLEREIHFDNRNFKAVQDACAFAQNGRRRALIDSVDSGAGKTYALEYYSKHHDNVLYIKITSLMKGRDLIDLLMQKLHITPEKRCSNAMKLHLITEKMVKPGYLIILDEMESCAPDIYRVLKDIEDATYRKCGLVISGLGIKDELQRGAARGKKLMPQLWRRFRSNIKKLNYLTKADIESACTQHGITDPAAIKVMQDLCHDNAILNEYIYDINELLIRAGHEVTAARIRGLFNPNQQAA